MVLIGGDVLVVGRGDAGRCKSLVDINAAADFIHDFKAIGSCSRTVGFAKDYREKRN